jgi:small ligand-binding sensory domain FIST
MKSKSASVFDRTRVLLLEKNSGEFCRIMGDAKPIARSAIVADERWDVAVERALAQVQGTPVDVALLFASGEYMEHYPAMLQMIRRSTGATILLGCSGEGVVGIQTELERRPALSLMTLSLPGATLRPVYFTEEMVRSYKTPQQWHAALDLSVDNVNAWLVFADPFRLDCEGLINTLSLAYAGLPLLGGLASNDMEERRTYVFYNDEVFDEGAVGLAIGGAYTLLPLVSQGCEPIGEPWTITNVQHNSMIATISNRPAYELLIETIKQLTPELQRRVQNNLFVGLAADEYRDHFERGSFLVRQLIGVDRYSGALAIGAFPRVGQTIQFQIRDATTADRDLQEMLAQIEARFGDQTPVAGILCTCNGRGTGMFGVPDHDAGAVAQTFGSLPLTGLFCSGEIGPIGKRSFLHGFTASLALLVKC